MQELQRRERLVGYRLDSAMKERNAHSWPNKGMETLDIPNESILFWKTRLARMRGWGSGVARRAQNNVFHLS